jgi:hypothetical protein
MQQFDMFESSSEDQRDVKIFIQFNRPRSNSSTGTLGIPALLVGFRTHQFSDTTVANVLSNWDGVSLNRRLNRLYAREPGSLWYLQTLAHN